jgi:hypothetical protein
MRNFYTGLDFDNDLIILGVNAGSSDRAKAVIYGHTDNPYYFPNPVRRSTPVGLIVFLVMFTLFSFGLLYFVYEKRKRI